MPEIALTNAATPSPLRALTENWTDWIDYWSVDVDTAHLAGVPDDPDSSCEVLRRVWEDTGKAEWIERAAGVDKNNFWYVVVDGDRQYPLIGGIDG